MDPYASFVAIVAYLRVPKMDEEYASIVYLRVYNFIFNGGEIEDLDHFVKTLVKRLKIDQHRKKQRHFKYLESQPQRLKFEKTDLNVLAKEIFSIANRSLSLEQYIVLLLWAHGLSETEISKVIWAYGFEFSRQKVNRIKLKALKILRDLFD